MEELKELKKFVKMMAGESSSFIKKYYRTGVAIERKNDESPVTIADKKTEEKLRELIMKEFPAHGIIGEEFGNYQENAEYKWVLDPIDGTKSFISGTPLFGTLIALTHNGQPVLGVINLPVLGEFLVGDNEFAELNGTQVQMRECDRPEDAIMLATDIKDIYALHDGSRFMNLVNKVRFFRTWGDCYGYYLLATGNADIMIDPEMHIWDTMALVPIIKGAGGIITDYAGKNPLTGKDIIAAGKKMHPIVISELN